MKLIVRQYLSALREREELDAILPDLLSELGLNVISRPSRGTTQYGVDVAAVGALNDGNEKVFLFSIKAGDLTRRDWDGDSAQSLRPSLNEILDVYIPRYIPIEHKDKEIVVCLCFGGDIREDVRPRVEGFVVQNSRQGVVFEQWNGDKLASLILSSFLKEELLPKNAHSKLRKTLALIDEPEASINHFKMLVSELSASDNSKNKLKSIRQINICLWILFSWARDIDNLESAYLSSEFALLNSWNIAKEFVGKKSIISNSVFEVFISTYQTYMQITSAYLDTKVLPFAEKLHCISNAANPNNKLDVNLKLFDVLGRMATSGLWIYMAVQSVESDEEKEATWRSVNRLSDKMKSLICANPLLCSPMKDSQVIDISLAVLLLMIDVNNRQFIRQWLSEIVFRASFSYQIKGNYPCTLQNYSDLLEHPEHEREDYLEEVTAGSVLFPMISFWAALIDDENLYSQVGKIKTDYLSHSTFQLWFPCEDSEEHFYNNGDTHGAVLSGLCIDRSPNELLDQVFEECDKSPHFKELSAVQRGFWPLILVACRHYRLPIPVYLFQGFGSHDRGSQE